MTEQYLEYPLQDGYIHHWLVAGPLSILVRQAGPLAVNELRLEVARRHHQRASDIHEQPVEQASFQIGESELTWRYAKCLDDHLLDLSDTYPLPAYLRSWAYCQLVAPSEQEAALILATYGPADLWVNRVHIHRYGGFSQNGERISVPVALVAGANEVLVRFEQVFTPTWLVTGECPYAVALRYDGRDSQAVTAQLPVNHDNVTRRQKLERVYAQAHIEQTVLRSGQNLALHWDKALDEDDDVSFLVQDDREHIQASGQWETRPDERLEIGHQQFILKEGPYNLVLLPPPWVIERNRITQSERLPFHVLENAFSEAYYGTYEERCQEALAHAAKFKGNLYAEIVKLHRGRWANMDAKVIEGVISQIDRHEAGSALDLIGLLGVLSRYAKALAWHPELQRSMERCVLDYSYGHEERVPTAMNDVTESQRILVYACELLAAQLYPEREFTRSGKAGRWHRKRAERLALEWLQQRAANGFGEWNSNDTFEQDLLVLSHLADLARDDTLRELSAVLMDKLLFAIALNSYKGVFGSSHGRTEAAMITGGQLEATSPVTRLMWGMGVWNHHIQALVGLVCSGYEVPPLIPAIAADLDQELWTHERHMLDADADQDVNTVTYRTADYMLCSAQDHRPGEPGDCEHVWQATLGPDAVAFVNHPAAMSQNAARRPNFWRGNGVLPRVAQWKDILIAVHRLPEGAKPTDLGFTHAYWPTYEFEETLFEQSLHGVQWAFARMGSGYLALAAAQGFEAVHRGPTAYRELRSYGRQNVWLCVMGRETTDGPFAEFREAVLQLDVEWQAQDGQSTPGLRCSTLRGDTLSFGWEGPLRVNGEEQPLSGYRHYDSRYCVAELGTTEAGEPLPMDIQYGDYTMRLSFEL